MSSSWFWGEKKKKETGKYKKVVQQ